MPAVTCREDGTDVAAVAVVPVGDGVPVIGAPAGNGGVGNLAQALAAGVDGRQFRVRLLDPVLLLSQQVADLLPARASYLSSLYALTRWRIWLFRKSQPTFLASDGT